VAPSEVPSRLREFDVALVLPTAPDPFPLAGLEAMASGLAVVAIPLGGVAEMVGEAALLVDPTPDSVAAALRALSADPALLAHHQQLGRERAAAFTWPEAADRLVGLVASRAAEG
jgi:glycosyltransferase involved in cell wall biosynthesis